jgi:hypothetical protein
MPDEEEAKKCKVITREEIESFGLPDDNNNNQDEGLSLDDYHKQFLQSIKPEQPKIEEQSAEEAKKSTKGTRIFEEEEEEEELAEPQEPVELIKDDFSEIVCA